MYEDELEHYGRLGMKWGQHIFGKEHVYKKSISKLKRLDKKMQKQKTAAAKLDYKSEKLHQKADRARSLKRYNKIANKASTYRLRSNLQLWRARKTETKAKEWANTMNNFFANMSIDSVSSDDIAVAKSYAVQVVQDYLDRK